MEEHTAARLAAELRAAGYTVTEKFGGFGVAGGLPNGPGPTLLSRTELGALPVAEETGLPDGLMPEITVNAAEGATSVFNDPALTRRLRADFIAWLGADRVKSFQPSMVSEDFSEFGRTVEHVPICLFRLGALSAVRISACERNGTLLPSLHSAKFAPVPEPAIKTGVTAMVAAALDLLNK